MTDQSGIQTSANGKAKGLGRSWLRKLRYTRNNDVDAPDPSTTAIEEGHSLEKKHQHHELEIRLVHLQPRSVSGETIQCHLTSQILVADSYEALSYEWGHMSPELSIDIDGVDTSVRENLWWALRHLQLEDRPRILWIDALCINQKDTEERNYQVSRMDYIYHSASRCIAWVGKEEIGPGLEVDDCKLAMEFINRTNSPSADLKPSTKLSTQAMMEHDSLELLCRRRYWTRLWIIQEVLLSKSVQVQCGSHSVPWTALSYLFDHLKTYVHASYQFSITSSAPFRLSQAWSLTVKGGVGTSPPPLADLVLLFKESQCEDPRDTVFGLIGLTDVCCRNGVPADYSTTPENLCTTLLLHHIAFHLDLKDASPDTTADIRDICFTVTSKSKITQDLQASIASLSIKARHAAWPDRAEERVQRGQVILILSAIDLQNALRRPKKAGANIHKLGIADQTPCRPEKSQADSQLLDVRGVVLNKLLNRSESWVAEQYLNNSQWERHRKSLEYIAKTTPSRVRFTHIFLTDTGYSGTTTVDTELGDAGSSKKGIDLKVTFDSKSSNQGVTALFNSSKLRLGRTYGICLDSASTFHELLSWVQ
ncbi:hypothetical protein IFR05_012209 [Cadophora sp. M221]|nr:hypothetical protein IFR05_012209 [Cadophora sp. M221]